MGRMAELRNDSAEVTTSTICNVANQIGIDPDAGLVQSEIETDHLTQIDWPDVQNFGIEPENLPGFTSGQPVLTMSWVQWPQLSFITP